MTHWIRLCLTLKRLFPSMFYGDFGPKHLCLTWLVDCCVYAWCFISCTWVVCLLLRPRCWHFLFIVAIVALLLSPSCNAMCCKMKLVGLRTRGLLTFCYCCHHRATRYDSIACSHTRPPCSSTLYATWYETHKGLVDNICCCCSHVIVVVVVTGCNMKLSCACAQGLVVDINHCRCHCNCRPREGYESPLPSCIDWYKIGAFALTGNGESSAQACAHGVVVILSSMLLVDCCLSIWWLSIWRTLAPAHEGCCWHVDVSFVLSLLSPLHDTIFKSNCAPSAIAIVDGKSYVAWYTTGFNMLISLKLIFIAWGLLGTTVEVFLLFGSIWVPMQSASLLMHMV
jgi:hypothetical protein